MNVMTSIGLINIKRTICVPVVAGALLLFGCGGRVARPVPESSNLDTKLSCDHVESEYGVNLAKMEDIAGERFEKNFDNAGNLLLDPLFLDFSGAEKKEVEALIARNERLLKLGEEKRCGPIAQKNEPDERGITPEE